MFKHILCAVMVRALSSWLDLIFTLPARVHANRHDLLKLRAVVRRLYYGCNHPLPSCIMVWDNDIVAPLSRLLSPRSFEKSQTRVILDLRSIYTTP